MAQRDERAEEEGERASGLAQEARRLTEEVCGREGTTVIKVGR